MPAYLLNYLDADGALIKATPFPTEAEAEEAYEAAVASLAEGQSVTLDVDGAETKRSPGPEEHAKDASQPHEQTQESDQGATSASPDPKEHDLQSRNPQDLTKQSKDKLEKNHGNR